MTAQTATIPTLTYLLVNGSSIQITTEYNNPESLPDTILARITEDVGIQDGISYIEGSGLIRMKNSPPHINYLLSNSGHLILICNTGDESNYSIDSNGHLAYSVTT